MHVHIDQPGEHKLIAQVEDARLRWRRRKPVAHVDDLPVFDQDRRVTAWLLAGSIEQLARVKQVVVESVREDGTAVTVRLSPADRARFERNQTAG